jgi:hypothetical protein
VEQIKVFIERCTGYDFGRPIAGDAARLAPDLANQLAVGSTWELSADEGDA